MSASAHADSTPSGFDPVLDDVIEEIANRIQAGESVDGEAILAKYPDRADSIRRLLPAMEVMAEFGVSASRLAASGVSPGLSPMTGELGTLGDFRILREVGRGGIGIVYEAEQISLNRRVALKVLPFAGAMDSHQLRRFRTEAQAAAQLHHTNIVPVFRIGCEQGVHYYAMQFIEGRTLADVIRELRHLEGKDRRESTVDQNEAPDDSAASALASAMTREFSVPADPENAPPPPAAPGPPGPSVGPTTAPPSTSSTRDRAYFRNVARLGIEAAEALEHAHQEGVVHRDIKPANLMLDARGHLWVTDFGLARLQNDSGLTITGDVLGTLRYMSPEQAMGRRGYLDHRTDIYSLGATLYELATLRPAIDGRDRHEILASIAQDEPVPPRRLNSAIPRELETILLKAMSKEPRSRYATAQEMADDLRRFLDYKPIRARRPTLLERMVKWSQRHRAAVIGTVVVLILATVALGASTILITRERGEAVRQRDRARKAVDEMYTEVAQKWLAQQPNLEPLQREFLLKALAFYQDFARERGRDPGARRGAADAEKNAGDILMKLGEHSRAEVAYGRAVESQEMLVAEFPRLPEYRVALANSYADHSMLQRRVGRLAEAQRSNRRALELRTALVAEFPDVPDHRKDLALSRNMLGYGLREESRFVEAERSVRQAVELLERLAIECPKNSGYRNHLIDILNHLGGLNSQMGNLAEAEREWHRAIELSEALRMDSPEVWKAPRFRKSLAYSYNNLGTLLMPMKHRSAEAEKAFRKALELLETLAAEFPAVPDYRKALATDYFNLGGLIKGPGRLAEAEQALRKAVEILGPLATRSPDVPDYRSLLGASLSNLGELQALRGELPEALSSFRRAIEEQQAALRSNPNNPTYREFLRNHHGGALEVLIEQGNHAGAAHAADEYARASPHFAQDSVRAAEGLVRCRQLAQADHRLSMSERRARVQDYADRAARLLKNGAEAAGDDPKALNALAWFLATCPEPRFRDPARAVALARRAVERAPKTGDFWNTLGVAQYRAGSWDGVIESLTRSIELNSGGPAGDWLFLAMAHWQKGEQDRALMWYSKAISSMDHNPSNDKELNRFRDEAKALLQVEDRDARMPNGAAAFAPNSAAKPKEINSRGSTP